MRHLTKRSVPAVAAIAIAGALPVQLADAQTNPNAHTAATTVQVAGKEYSFKLSTKSIGRTGTVTFNFRNVGHTLHDFKINGKRTPLVRAGKSSRLVVSFRKKGRYSYECTVPGHAALGMKGVITVR